MRFWFLIRCICIFLIFILCKECQGHSTQLHDQQVDHEPDKYDQNNQTEDSKSSSLKICHTPGCYYAASQMLNYIDTEINPCDNFYKFACGQFLKSVEIPKYNIKISNFVILRDKVKEQLRAIIEEESQVNETRPLTIAKNLYKLCMNTTAIEEKGLTTMLNILKSLGGWPVLEGDSWQESDFDWKQSVYKIRELGRSFKSIFSLDIRINLKDNKKRLIEIDQASLGLFRVHFVKGLKDKTFRAYYNYMVDIAVIFGANKTRAKTDLLESLKFEMKLANISLPSEGKRNKTALYNIMSVRELQKKYSTIPWMEYINTILKPYVEIDENEIVNVRVPSYFSKLEKLLQETPKKTLANYIMWRLISESINFLNEEIRNRQLDYNTIVSGKMERTPRWKECLFISNLQSVNAVFVRKYVNEESKKSAVELVNNIQQEFKKILQEVKWMDPITRQNALEKTEAMNSFISHPDELLNDKYVEEYYEQLNITMGDYYQAILNISLFNLQKSINQLRKPASKLNWTKLVKPSTVNAYYSPIENSIQIPAGILQGFFFNNSRPWYMNYGGIGWIIGHETTHGFDDKGHQFDKEGNLVDWWQPETKEHYLKKAECIIQQYGNYSSEIGLNLNGVNTQGENIADNGGIKESYYAYQEWVKNNGPEPILPGLNYTPSQLFWISAAQIRCEKIRPEALKKSILTNVHSPMEFRVLGAFSNRPEFSRDFNCPVGSKMNPEKKCSVW